MRERSTVIKPGEETPRYSAYVIRTWNRSRIMVRWFRGLANQKLSRFNPKPKRRGQKTWRLMFESLEDRLLPSISVGPNINISRLLGNQKGPNLAMNPTNPLHLLDS